MGLDSEMFGMGKGHIVGNGPLRSPAAVVGVSRIDQLFSLAVVALVSMRMPVFGGQWK